jgi:alginate O-acetyltransferase complex protein AlgI
MVFNSDIFLFAFLPIVLVLFWTMRNKQSRYVIMTVAGYVFYGYWNWHFCFLLLFSSLVSFTAGNLMTRARSGRAKRTIVAFTVGTDLTLLGFFKYYDFLARSVSSLLPGVHLPLLDIVLPIGISFYTFHTISYVIDVSAGRVRATRNLFEYLTYVSLFSQLVAGPIVRFRQIEEDLEHLDGPPREDWVARGIAFFVIGLIKKVMIADHIASDINPMLQHVGSMTVIEAWVAALGYTCQLYFDFSGYSDMAVGLGLLFGLRIPQNFNSPYWALGITDFWRRWHISLSSWLRDYLYFPLGGNRHGTAMMFRNLMIVMLLGGLWHGANWTFVVWGGYHGLLLALDRLGAPFYSKLSRRVYQLQTFLLVVVGWVLFRSSTFDMALQWLRHMFVGRMGSLATVRHPAAWTAVALVIAATVPEAWEMRFGTSRRWAVLWGVLFVMTYFFMNGKESVFLYYQF